MNPFEDLIHSLGTYLETPLEPDSRQSCLIQFPKDQLSVQIDLDTNADRILIGSDLGRLNPGKFREEILLEALRMNGSSLEPRGILAYSEKKDSLILFQFLPILALTGETLYAFLKLFLENAKLWKYAIEKGEIPHIDVVAHEKLFGAQP